MAVASTALSLAADGGFEEAQRSIATHGKSFALASLWFGPALRDEVAAVYAFCRRADDAIDLAPRSEVGTALARLFEELERVYLGEPQTEPVLHAFQTVTLRRAIPKPYVQELLLGMQMDVEDTRYETLPDLLLYCHRVAGVVGLMMCHVLGARTQASLANAVHLGVAMQLTNICRDVAEDAQRGRTYLPARWLADAPTASVVARLLDEADRYYRSGERGIIALPFRAALAVRTARHVYAAIGSELRRRGCDVSAGRARVPGWRKLWWVGVSLLQSLAELPARLRPARTTNLSLVRYEDVLPL